MLFPFEEEIILENDVVLLRPLLAGDTENLLAVATEDKMLLQFSPKPVYSETLLSDYISSAVDQRNQRSRYAFLIYSKDGGTFAGSTSFMNISEYDKRLEIGSTWIGRSFQGTGLNRACKILLLHYAFETLGAERVEFRTDERNIQSRKAIEKLGAAFEGILRKHTLLYDGYMRNTVYYSMLKEEWMTSSLRQQNS
jgi:N-acetyltransferase